jgi:DNA repair protein RadC
MATATTPPGDLDRPRERVAALGGDRASDVDLLAVLLGVGVRRQPAERVAEAMLRTAGGLVPLSRATPGELSCVPGVGPVRALRVAAAFHLGRRALELGGAATPALTCAADVYRRVHPRLAGLGQEVFWVMGLDVKHRVIGELEVARGTLDGVAVHPRDVFRPLLRMAAVAGIVVHNHPSGDPTPSPEDVELTRRLRDAGQLVGVPIVDHVVVGAGDWSSLAAVLR